MERACEGCGILFTPAAKGAAGRKVRFHSVQCAADARRIAGCSVAGCARSHIARGLCDVHYRRLKRGLPMDGYVRGSGFKRGIDPCVVSSCTRMVFNCKHGLCAMHYERWSKYRDVGSPAPLRRPAGTWSEWRINNWGYVVRHMAGTHKWEMQHRTVMEEVLGRPLGTRENVHHKNGIRHDNRPENLELWVKPQPGGQRVEDLVEWVVEHYRARVEAALDGRPQLRLLG